MGDSRLVLLLLGAGGVEAAGAGIASLLRKFTQEERLARRLHGMERAGLVESSGDSSADSRVMRLTTAGERALWGEVDPEVLWNRPWDGRWRVALFDVPQSQAGLRLRLRRRLRALRFGWLQNSVWLSPDPLSETLTKLSDEKIAAESLLFIEGRPAGGETDDELVKTAWDFEGISRGYTEYLKLLRDRPTAGRGTKIADWSKWLSVEDKAWQQIVRADPLLPAPLLPASYQGRTAVAARKRILSESARVLLKHAPHT